MKKKIFITLALSALLALPGFSQKYLVQVKSPQNDKWGYLDVKGDFVVQPQYEKCFEFSPEGVAPVYDTKAKQYFFIKTDGSRLDTEIKEFKLLDRMGFSLEGFGDGLIPVRYKDKWGFLNAEGKLAIEAKYDQAKAFAGGYSSVMVGKQVFIINTNGDETPLNDGILEVRDFSEGVAPFKGADKKMGFLNPKGEVVIKNQFESVGYFRNGLAWAKSNDGKVGYIDPAGAWVINPQFTVGGHFDKESGMARVKVGADWAYVDRAGKVLKVSETTVWEDFSEGLAIGKKDGLVGFFNNKGEWVIKPQFEAARDFKNGFACVKKGATWGLIDKSGNWVVDPKFDGIKDVALVK